MLKTIADNYLWFLVLILLGNIAQRKHQERSQRKRMATLIIASLAMVLQVFITIILARQWPQWLFFPALAVTLALVIPFRKRLFIFKTTCASCSKKLTFTQAFNFDDNLCDACHAQQNPRQESPADEEHEQLADEPSQATKVSQIDWDVWEPAETAVLCYLIVDGSVLLIEKKRGLGAGLVNAPGGHIEADETAAEAAVRETSEETGLTVQEPVHMGTLEFQFTDGLAMRGHVFFANAFSGNMVETDEALPFWCPLEDIPYDRMWEDDRIWLPMALQGRHFYGRFIFADKKMLDSAVEIVTSQED